MCGGELVSTWKQTLSGMRRIIGWPPKSSDKTINCRLLWGAIGCLRLNRLGGPIAQCLIRSAGFYCH